MNRNARTPFQWQNELTVAGAAKVLFDEISAASYKYDRPHLSFGMASTGVSQKQNSDGTTTLSGTLVIGDNPHSDGGLTAPCPVTDFLQKFPSGKSELQSTYHAAAKKAFLGLKDDLVSWITKNDGNRFLQALVGWEDAPEWGLASKVTVERMILSSIVHMSRFNIWVPILVDVRLVARRKTAITQAPFDTMSDKELNGWIERWENDAPENFWQDGELGLSRPAAYAMYRKRWRAMTPRAQTQMMEDLSGRTAHQMAKRVATAFLHKHN